MKDLPPDPFLDEDVEVVPIPAEPEPIVPVPLKSLAERKAEPLRELEEEIRREALGVLANAMHAADFDETAEEMPEGFGAGLPEDEARRAFRVARWAQLPSKQAPVVLKMASQIAMGLSAVRAREGERDRRPLNIAVAQLNIVNEAPKYEERPWHIEGKGE